MNKVFLIGNLTKNPEVTQSKSGVNVCQFSIAVSKPFKHEGDSDVDFFNCTAFNTTAANLAKYTVKGSKICVLGNLQNHSYEDGEGKRKTVMKIIVDAIEFLSTRNQESEVEQYQPKRKQDNGAVQYQPKQQSISEKIGTKPVVKLEPFLEDDDIPF